MLRALCPVETLYVGQRSRAVLSTALRGRVDAGALSAAFDAVTRAHPSLRTRIVPDGDGFALRLLDEAERPRLATRTGTEEDAWATELNTPLPVGGPLSRAVLVSAPEGEEHLFVLSVDHTITDGHSSIALNNEIWDRYRALVEGEAGPGAGAADARGDSGYSRHATASSASGAPDASGALKASGALEAAVEEPGWPVPVSRLLPDADETATAAYLARRVEETRAHPVELLPYDVPPGSGDGRIEVCRLTFDEERTTRLRHSARQAGVSVHALICAVLLITARRRLAGDEPRTLGCLSPVDLRSRLSPPLSAAVMVPAVTTHRQAVEVGGQADPVALARTVHARLSDFVAGDGPHHEMRITPEIPRNPALQLATVIATNMGVVAGPRLPDGLQATDVRLAPAREQYFPQAGRSPVMACVVSFEGRLAIEFPYFTACFSPSFVGALRDEVQDGLAAFADAAEPAAAPAS
ncbi:condensation domain-containing protein [Streptomyces sp. NPDC051452]|uniref:phthiocerol/phthiodiolone dimycocerosyl transferase family protein n=1 Tax=Streptomyces sp. NPDC051452 TaxID=3365654 RepID=UPI00379025E1